MARLFGTDGVRGIANDSLDCEMAYRLGYSAAKVLTGAIHKPKILVGRDTRISGNMLECALVAGICAAGAEANELGVISTSAVAYLTRNYEVDAGAMISASHNSYEYNGIKFFNGKGYKLADSIEDEIERLVLGGDFAEKPTGMGVGRNIPLKNAVDEYIDFLVEMAEEPLSGIKLVIDCANGSASEIAPRVFRALGAKVFSYHDSPDGSNINDNCGSTKPQHLMELVKELGADVGLAFDGDADRMMAVDEKGRLVDGDKVMAICALDMKERGLLKKDVLVGTVMSNLGLELGMKEHGIKLVKTDVGDRYVLEEMLKSGYNLGGEQSGHIIFLDHNTTGDGILTGIQLLGVMKRRDERLGRLAKVVTILPQVLVNAHVSEAKKHEYAADDVIMDKIRVLEKKMDGRGRVLIRPSGTEPLVRVMIEGEDRSAIESEAVAIAELIESRLA
ncbi:MAG: phosphoglucosamine mutase [Clostridiales bacterium]|nr:MAG: phosphoglucosamine mutase [Clostridiales bacterium]